MEAKDPDRKARSPLDGSIFSGPGERKKDAYAEIFVPLDGMEARASFHPAAGDGAPLTLEYVLDLLRRAGVVEGLLEGVLAESVEACNRGLDPLTDIVVARGTPPEDQAPEHLRILPRFRQDPSVEPVTGCFADRKDLSRVVMVTRGERIAELVPARPGKPGRTVRAEASPPRRCQVPQYLTGRNVRMEDLSLVAEADGRFLLSGNRVDVEEVLIAKDGAGRHTGHIVFPGDVILEGPVTDGVKVHSGGSILAKDTMDVFDVIAKKDIVCSGGLVGHQKGLLKAGGELRAGSAQNCRISVRGDVHIPGSLVSCQLSTQSLLEMGDRGRIIGGEIFAVHGVRCGWIGSDSGQATFVHVGIDYTVKQRLDLAGERLQLMRDKRDKLERLGPTRPAAKIESMMRDLDQAASELSALIADLLPRLDADERAFVDIRGEAFPGAVIEICRVRFQLQEVIGRCILRLDKASGRIVRETT